MKSKILRSLVLLVLTFCATSVHAHEPKADGPNHGRLLTKIDPPAEFFVTAERKVQITFLDASGSVVPPANQVVTVTAGERAAPVKLTFTRQGDVLISEAPLPAGNAFPAVVQIKLTPDAPLVNEKFTVNLSRCPECKNAEYACICAH